VPLADDIRATRDQTLSLLNDTHDYFTYTKRSWRILQAAVLRDGMRFILRNQATNSTVDQNDLLARAQRYVSVDLSSATLQQFVSTFESYLMAVLRLWLRAYPAAVSARQVKGEQILALPDKGAIVDALIDKELQDVLYDRPANWFKYLNGRVALGCPTDGEVQQFAEIKATRDVLVHGGGVATSIYADKAGPLARAVPGQPLDVPEPYHRASWELIGKLVHDIGTTMAARA
jgi:hypothetical protein